MDSELMIFWLLERRRENWLARRLRPFSFLFEDA